MDSSQTLGTLTDSEVISRILGGETSFYELIVRRYDSYLYKIGRSYGFNHADTEDLMQETYVNAYVHLKGFENRSSFKTWLVKIMLNQCYHKKQKLSMRNEVSSQSNIEEKSVPMFSNSNTNTGKSVVNSELKHVLEEAVRKIPEDYRMVFALRELNGMNVNETAEALHITESNVKVRLNRAKAMLRNEIQKVYSPDEIFEFNLIYCAAMVERVMKAIARVDESNR